MVRLCGIQPQATGGPQLGVPCRLGLRSCSSAAGKLNPRQSNCGELSRDGASKCVTPFANKLTAQLASLCGCVCCGSPDAWEQALFGASQAWSQAWSAGFWAAALRSSNRKASPSDVHRVLFFGFFSRLLTRIFKIAKTSSDAVLAQLLDDGFVGLRQINTGQFLHGHPAFVPVLMQSYGRGLRTEDS